MPCRTRAPRQIFSVVPSAFLCRGSFPLPRSALWLSWKRGARERCPPAGAQFVGGFGLRRRLRWLHLGASRYRPGLFRFELGELLGRHVLCPLIDLLAARRSVEIH